MLKSIELNSHVRNRLAEYLKSRGLDFQAAMQEEQGNKEIASIVHGGLPVLVRKTVFRTENAEVFLGKKRIDYDLYRSAARQIGFPKPAVPRFQAGRLFS